MKKLFSFDLDGTLLNNEGSIFIENIEAIEKASGKYGRFDEAVKKIDPRKE